MSPTRRDFLKLSGGCLAHVALNAACASRAQQARWTAPLNPTVATTPFGRLDLVAPDTWALVSTPLGGDRTTYANGGIIAGRSGVIAVEGFYRPAGAAWLAARARELTGRWPTHVVLTHYHTDHAGGLAGYRDADAMPVTHATAVTRDLALGGGPVAPAKDAALTRAFADVVLIAPSAPSRIDLGNRRIELRALRGHTASDTVLVDHDAGITWAGDLVWNGMFPNFVDATPSVLAASVDAVASTGARTVVGGHGAVADRGALQRYRELLASLETAGRAAFASGTSAKDAAAAYEVPAALGEWMAAKPSIERAMTAWRRELESSR